MKNFSLFMIALICFVGTRAQQRSNTITLGPSFSYPLPESGRPNILKPGPGVDLTVEFRTGIRGGVLFQGGIAAFKSNEKWLYYEDDRLTVLSFKAGYRHYLTPGAFYVNVMPGYDYYSDKEPLSFSITAGGVRRIAIGQYFLDAGIDFIDGKTERRVQARIGVGIFAGRNKTGVQP